MCNDYKLKNIITLLPKSSIKASDGGDEGDFPFFTSSQIQNKFLNDFTFDAESLILGTGGSASVHYYDGKFSVSTDCLTLSIDNSFYSKYVYYFLKANQNLIDDLGFKGVGIKHLQKDFLYALKVKKYSLEHQIKISNYLDSKLSEIEDNISKNKKIIALLEEKKVALINHCVTKGLDDNVPMKDSGIEWIGGIPEHWDYRRIISLCSVSRGASPRPIDDPIYFDENGEYSWVRISDVTASNKYLKNTDEKLSLLGKALSVPIEPDDIFISIAGTVGKPIISKIKCCIHDGFVYFKNLKMNKEYLYYIFEGKEAYKGLGKLGTQLNLNTETIGNITIPYPPIEEQNKIVNFLDIKLTEIDKTIIKIQSKIDLLEEYKQSLIYHTVAGKVEV